MKIKVFGDTHPGMVRENNEDAYGIFPELSLYVVADGLGGHAGGEVASHDGGIDLVIQHREVMPAGGQKWSLSRAHRQWPSIFDF